MNREEYIKQRNNNAFNFQLFYDYYKLNCKEPLVKSLDDFMVYFGLYFNINQESILAYFDNKFTVIKVINIKTQQIIRYE